MRSLRHCDLTLRDTVADKAAARRAIEDAYTNFMDVGAYGRTLINVEDGAALADCAEAVRR